MIPQKSLTFLFPGSLERWDGAYGKHSNMSHFQGNFSIQFSVSSGSDPVDPGYVLYKGVEKQPSCIGIILGITLW